MIMVVSSIHRQAYPLCYSCMFSLLAFLLVVATLYDIVIYQPRLYPPVVLDPPVDPASINQDSGVAVVGGSETPTSTSSEIRTTLDVNEYTPLLKADVGLSPEDRRKSVEANTRKGT